MGDLTVGDMVFDEKGNPTRVTAAFDVMYQHKCYEVMFSDGSSLVADTELDVAAAGAIGVEGEADPGLPVWPERAVLPAVVQPIAVRVLK